MKEIKIDESKVIKIEPSYRIWGVVIENEKHRKRLELSTSIATVCGILGTIGLLSILFYIIFT